MGQYRIAEEYFPGVTVVEDDDGIRMLLVPEARFPSWVYDNAMNHSIAAVIVGDSYWLVDGDPPSRFGGTEVEIPDLRPCPHPTPSYRQLRRAAKAERTTGFVHLHAHSEHSALDGYSTIDEMIAAVVADGQPALAVTDHGACAAHPHLAAKAAKAGIKPLFGIEAYLVHDRFDRESLDYYHLILLAETDAGLRNLWAMSTEAYRDGFYGKPRMDWDTLSRLSDGVIASTACLRGPLAHPLLKHEAYDLAVANLARLNDIFRDRLYVEIHTNALDEQRKVNDLLVDLARQYSLPLVAAVDSHYACPDDKDAHATWLAVQIPKKDGIAEDTGLFSGGHDYHLMTAGEVTKALGYLPAAVIDEAMANTVAVAERCTASMVGRADPPVFSRSGGPAADVDRLLRICLGNWAKTLGKSSGQEVYEARFEREMKLLIDKGFCGYYLMVHDQVDYAKRNRILVGPGRGSGSGSLVAYLMGITEIDPVDTGLLFERFLTEGRAALPDFDVDYPSSEKDRMAAYAVERWGADRVVRVGTHLRLKNKGVIRDLTRVLNKAIDNPRLYPDMDLVAKHIDDIEASTAGLGMPWDEMWEAHAETLNPYREKYPTLFAYADRMVGRLKSYGRHAAGFVISPDEPLIDRLPLWAAKDGQLVAEFDMEALESLGLVKFDLLNLRNLDTIQKTVDLIREQEGVEIDVYSWKNEYDDPLMWEEIGKGHTLGIFQIETKANTKIAKEFRPRSLRELADLITIGRPGPKNSGLMKMYLQRRAGLEPVTYPHPSLEHYLGDTFGCILYQEQVMQTCMILGGYTSEEADEVRRILGKKKTSRIPEEGQRFITRCLARGHDRQAMAALWEQLAEFAKYSFNRSHAWAYAILGVWTAYLKFHYPLQFFTALLSTEEKGRLPEVIQEARRMGLRILPPDINESGVGFKVTPRGIRYGLDQIKGIGDAAVKDIVAGQPYTSWDDYLARKGRAANSGVTRTLVEVGAFDRLIENRRALVDHLDFQANKPIPSADCRWWADVPGLSCTFDWFTEPPKLGKSGRPLKNQPGLPAKCSRACRQYAPREGVAVGARYSDAEIRTIEERLLGIALSSTPFDTVHPSILEDCHTAEEVGNGDDGEYLVLAVVSRLRPTQDRYGRKMAFMTLYARDGDIDVVVFHEAWEKYHRDIRQNEMALALLAKNERGCQLKKYQPC